MFGYRLYKGAWIWELGPHLENKISDYQIKTLLNKGGLLVRNTYNFDCQRETGFWFVIKDSFNGFQDVPSKYRSRIKKALDAFYIQQVPQEYLLKNGYDLYIKTVKSYRIRTKPLTHKEFEDLFFKKNYNFDYWVCIHKDTARLAAFSINQLIDNTACYLIMKFLPDFNAKLHPSYGLIYEMNRYYLDEKKMLFVSDGTRSLTNHSEFQPFLIKKFKFRKAYCDLHVVYQSWLGLTVKLLFPFRRYIKGHSIAAILRQEEWARQIDRQSLLRDGNN